MLTKIINDSRKEFKELKTLKGEEVEAVLKDGSLLSQWFTNLLLALSEERVEKMKLMLGEPSAAIRTLIKEEEDFIKFLKEEVTENER